jgi:hypothetical protein
VDRKVTVRARPANGSRRVATLSSSTRGAVTWVPVLEQRAGWVRVGVPGPRGRGDRTGWVPATAVTVASTGHAAVTVHVAARTITVQQDGHTRTWPVLAVGPVGTSWATPLGTHHIQRVVRPTGHAGQLYRLVVESSARSADAGLATSGGSLGDRVAIHGWRQPLASGATSHGCVRVGDAALNAIAALPLGTPIRVVAR